MKAEEFFNQINAALNGDINCDFGSEEKPVADFKSDVKSLNVDKPICLIKNWVWVDIAVDEETSSRYEQRGIRPALVHGDVLFDEQCRGFKVVWSSALVEFINNYMFVTKNSAYVLVGPGRRGEISAEAYSCLYF